MFKIKNKKIFQGDNRITLDAKHNEFVKEFERNKIMIPLKEKQISKLRNDLKKLDLNDFNEIKREILIREEIEKIETEINNIKNNVNENDYYMRTVENLFEYEDYKKSLEEEIDFKEEVKKEVHSNKLKDFVKEKFNTDIAFLKYLEKVDPSFCIAPKSGKLYEICQRCKKSGKIIEMMINLNDASAQCSNCGLMEYVLVDSDKPSYKEPPPEATYFAYKRINHFSEILAQVQAKQSTDIPQEVYDDLKEEIRKERIMDYSKLTYQKVRGYLRKLRYNKYYEHIIHIINKLNGNPPPHLSKELEEKLKAMFREIQGPFMEVCPGNRKNFFSYNYILHKFVELLGLEELKPLFPLLKSREKVHQHDLIWRKICDKLKWKFIKSV